jgi:hypothetical protein
LFEHLPPVQLNVQHSLPEVHVASGGAQLPTGAAHSFVAPSQLPVQQSPLDAHPAPTS